MSSRRAIIGAWFRRYLSGSLVLLALVVGSVIWTICAQVNSREDALVDWALRLPTETKRIKIAGYGTNVDTRPVVDPARNAATEWERIQAVLLAEGASTYLPGIRPVFPYVNPKTRRKSDHKKVRGLSTRFARFLPMAMRSVKNKPLQFSHWINGRQFPDGIDSATLIAGVSLVVALDEIKAEKWISARDHLLFTMSIARQLQYDDSLFCFRNGIRLELVSHRLIREALTDSDKRKRDAWKQVLKDEASVSLLNVPNEDRALEQFRRILRFDIESARKMRKDFRKEEYKPSRTDLEQSVALLRYLNRMRFYLFSRIIGESSEAIEYWDVAGLETRLRSCHKSDRVYVLWKAAQNWDKRAARQTENLPDGFRAGNWQNILEARLYLETERALTQATWGAVAAIHAATLPEDPFAAVAGQPLKTRNLPDGTRIIYSVIDLPTDDGGVGIREGAVRIPKDAISSSTKP